MLLLASGVVIGILLSIVAVLAGKKWHGFINSDELPRFTKKALIIKKNNDPFEEFLHEN